MTHNIVFLGGGGHCRSLRAVLLQNYGGDPCDLPWKVIEDTRSLTAREWALLCSEENKIVLAVGQLESSDIRHAIVNKCYDYMADFTQVVSRTAVVDYSAKIGMGSQILNFAVINAYAEVGDFVIINTSAIIEHDARVGHFTHVSTGAVVNGGSSVGRDCFIGSNSVISNGVNICDQVIVGAGSVIIKDIDIPGTYVGNPARRVR